MLPPSHPVIEAITQPFADNAELKLSAIRILEESFDPDHPGASEMIRQLEKQDGKKSGWLRKSVIWIVAVLTICFTLYSEIPLIKAFIDLQDLMGYSSPDAPAFPSHLTAQEKLLLGDPSLDELKQKQLLLESDPDNPAYYAEYAQAYHNRYSRLPDDFLETVARIDPENSFFLYWAASEYERKAIEKLPLSGTRSPRYQDGVKLRPLPVETEYKILDQTAYDEASQLIERASQLPKFDNYTIRMLKTRMSLIPKPDSLVEHVRAVAYQFSASSGGIISLVKTARLFEAKAEELSKNGDKDGFVLWAKHRDAFLNSFGKAEGCYLVDVLVYQVVSSTTAVNFQAGADRLGLTELEEKYRMQNEAFIAERDRRDLYRSKTSAMDQLIEKKAGFLNRATLPMVGDQINNPPILTDSDLKPMRMAEHEFAGRFGVIAVGLALFAGALFVFLFRFLATRTIRLTAKRFACLLKFSDWLWIASLGVVLPILAFQYFNRISPFSGRDFGISYFLFLFPSLHLVVLLLNLLFIPAMITRWRLKRRAAAFRFGSWLDGLALPVIAVMLVYSIAAYPAVVNFPHETPLKIALAAPLVGWVGFVFFNALRIFLGSARSRIIQCATSIAVLPAYALAAGMLCLLVPIYKAGEKYWVPQDTLLLINPDAPDLGAYEFRIAAQKRREINEILGF